LLLSRGWYGDFDFCGRVAIDNFSYNGLASIIVRHSGRTESYLLVIGPQGSRIYLQENHFGESHEAVVVRMKDLGKESQIGFRITAKGSLLMAVLWPLTRSEAEGVAVAFPDLKLPEGRIGFGVRNSGITYAGLRVKSTRA
jgi:hypothetical protein